MALHQESEFTKEVSSEWDTSWMFAQILCEDEWAPPSLSRTKEMVVRRFKPFALRRLFLTVAIIFELTEK